MLDKKILIIDFEDSFTFNISEVLFHETDNFSVVHFEHFFSNLDSILREGLVKTIILGPGPGHPDEYSRYFPFIKKIISDKKIFVMGICLGHQIVSRILGFDIIYSKNPYHGESYEICYKSQNILVQRYNSLAVKNNINWKEGYILVKEEEVLILKSDMLLTMQFHPESIGTSHRSIFFEEVFL